MHFVRRPVTVRRVRDKECLRDAGRDPTIDRRRTAIIALVKIRFILLEDFFEGVSGENTLKDFLSATRHHNDWWLPNTRRRREIWYCWNTVYAFIQRFMRRAIVPWFNLYFFPSFPCWILLSWCRRNWRVDRWKRTPNDVLYTLKESKTIDKNSIFHSVEIPFILYSDQRKTIIIQFHNLNRVFILYDLAPKPPLPL